MRYGFCRSRPLSFLARRWQRPQETSRVILGSSGSGKSEGELSELVRLAQQGAYAVVLLDGHGPLADRAAGHWLADGHYGRLVYEPLAATDRVLCWHMLPRSAASTPLQRQLEDAETCEELVQCLVAPRGLATLTDRPWTKEWLEAAIALCLAQPEPQPLSTLLDAFRIQSAAYERLLQECDRAEVAAKFRALEQLHRRNRVQYELLTGPARRLLELVCTSAVIQLRARAGPFNWLAALRSRALIAFDGGGLRSKELKRTLFLLVSLQVLQAVRRHFAETQQPLPVVLVLEEAGALDLVTPFVLSALQELRKAGLAIHLITQSSLDFGAPARFEQVLANTPWQAWYQTLTPADQELGAKVFTNATFDSHQVHFTRTRPVPNGTNRVPTESHSVDWDTRTGARRYGRSWTLTQATRYRVVVEPYFKNPQLQEQEFRTRLATLRVGERLVRDRTGVWCERIKRLRPPRLGRDPERTVRLALERLRQQPIYLPCPAGAVTRAAVKPLDAAARLRQECARVADTDNPGAGVGEVPEAAQER